MSTFDTLVLYNNRSAGDTNWAPPSTVAPEKRGDEIVEPLESCQEVETRRKEWTDN